MRYHFIYPADYFNHMLVDETYREEAAAMLSAGFSFSTVGDNFSLMSSYGHIDPLATVVYRGWMIEGSNYQNLVNLIEARDASPITTTEQYLLTHHLPNWYNILEDLTPATAIFANGHISPQGFEDLKSYGWKKYFIKDYVKSLKTSIGSIVLDVKVIENVISEMRKFRGTIEGGICVREVEDFMPETETRYFVLNGKVYSPDSVPTGKVGSFEGHCLVKTAVYANMADFYGVVEKCAARIDSNFFTIDVVLRKDGVVRVVEIGDGQVSDLVGWDVESFVKMWVDQK